MLNLLDELVKEWMNRSMPQILHDNYTLGFQHSYETTGTFIQPTLTLDTGTTTRALGTTDSIEDDDVLTKICKASFVPDIDGDEYR